ncbi:MAG: MATE family efflux transporter [Ruminococcus sp.]|nr:MATE family efflux transporter [Ruminococcus sp.]
MEKDKTLTRMAETPVNKLMLSMGIPMIVSMVLQAFYNIVDSAFVSNMKTGGEEALNALTLAFPIQMLMVAVSIGTGVGTNALLAKSLGQGDKKRAARVAGNAEFLGLVIFGACLLFGIVGVRPYIMSQTSNPVITEMAVSYLRICCVLSPGIVFFSVFEKLLQATGLSLYSTIAQISGAVINMIFDPILIYGLFGLPKLGVRGAAYATVIGQIASFLMAFVFHLRKNTAVENGLRFMKPDKIVIRGIYAIGLPAIISQALMSVMTYGLNLILGGVDESMVTAYGLYYKIQQFILFAAFGLRDAITPIVSFSHGMGSKERVRQGVRYGMIYTLIIMAAGLIGLEIFAVPLAGVFGLSGNTQRLCISAIRIISLSFVCAGINIAAQGIFQALDKGGYSLVISVLRQLLLVLPVAFGFALIAKKNTDLSWLVWLTFPIAEILSAVTAMIFLRKTVPQGKEAQPCTFPESVV